MQRRWVLHSYCSNASRLNFLYVRVQKYASIAARLLLKNAKFYASYFISLQFRRNIFFNSMRMLVTRATLFQRGISCLPAVSLCLGGHKLEYTSRSGWTDRYSFGRKLRLPSTYLTPCDKKIWISLEIRVLPSGTLPKFCTSKFSYLAAVRRSSQLATRCQLSSTEVNA